MENFAYIPILAPKLSTKLWLRFFLHNTILILILYNKKVPLQKNNLFSFNIPDSFWISFASDVFISPVTDVGDWTVYGVDQARWIVVQTKEISRFCKVKQCLYLFFRYFNILSKRDGVKWVGFFLRFWWKWKLFWNCCRTFWKMKFLECDKCENVKHWDTHDTLILVTNWD